MNIYYTRQALLLLTAGSAALLTGCGGGGNGNSNFGGTTGNNSTTGSTGTTTGTTTGTAGTSQIVGKVTDVTGKGIPGVSIAVDSGGQITMTITTGGYRLNNLSANVHKISAAATVNGLQYTGSTETSTTPNNLTSNANILISPTNQQATVQGVVRDTSGNPIAGASVYVAVPNIPLNGSAGNYSSLVAFTDGNGFYQISNIPSSLQTGSLFVTASSPATANQNATLPQNSVTPGSVSTQNFTLSASTNQLADTPTIVGVTAFTQPTDGLTGSALKASLTARSLSSGSVYESLRRRLSPTYASFAGRKTSLGKRLSSRAVSSSYAVETDIAFNPPAATNTNLLFYNIYRTTGALSSNPVLEAPADFYDNLVDPLANYFTDVTASSDQAIYSPYTANTAYNFALSSVASASGATSTNRESALSTAFTIIPLSPLTLTAPTVNQTVTSPVTLSWTPVAGATKYYVFVYSQYPGAGSSPILQTSTPLTAGTSSTTVTLTGGSLTYYAIVVATEDETETATATAPITNAAQSYSEITQFVVR